MVITINGKSETTDVSFLLDLLHTKKIEPRMVAVELNDAMIEGDRLASTPLQEGDRVEFLFYMGGGE